MDNFLEQARNQLTSCENPEEILVELNDHIEENKKYYEEIMIEGLLIAESKISFIEKEKYLDKFIPKINKPKFPPVK